MPPPIITLTTDFGPSSPYVAAMKGTILRINPAAHIVDLSHQIPPQDVLHGAFFMAESIPYFPAEAIHVAVIDPGVGTDRRPLLFCSGKYRIVAPDNGVCTILMERHPPKEIYEITNQNWWRPKISSTFHGRDIFAPVAAHLSLGNNHSDAGPPANDWQKLPTAPPVCKSDEIRGEIIFIDDFGNLITNISHGDLANRPGGLVQVDSTQVTHWVRTYGDAESGELVCLFSSFGLLEIAQVQGSAARRLNCEVGTSVSVRMEGTAHDE